MTAYYNENDPFAAAWLRSLIGAGLIAPGHVDERSILDVTPADLAGFTQCHFFAGIGVWSYALRNAGWPDDSPVWTGSCPCQSFSQSGKRGGFGDPRHLWPAWWRLIRECRPHVVFGEQVASNDGLAWLDVVCSDLEGAGYAVGAADLCAAGFGAPHIRQRLYFVAESMRAGRVAGRPEERSSEAAILAGLAGPNGLALSADGGRGTRLGHVDAGRDEPHDEGGGEADGLADADESGQHGRASGGEQSVHHEMHTRGGGVGDSPRRGLGMRGGASGQGGRAALAGEPDGVGNTEEIRRRGREDDGDGGRRERASGQAGPTNGFWRSAVWLPCRDGKLRPVEPGSPPLAHGVARRVGKLRGFGNALCAPVAEGFIRAFLGR